jgi:hypothetical protein
MLLSEMLGLPVDDHEGHPVGTVVDVRLGGQPGRTDGAGPTQLLGFVVSPHTRSSYLGYERTDVTAPAMISGIVRWRHRGTFLATWGDVARIGAHSITLRSGYRRYSARLASHRRGRTDV